MTVFFPTESFFQSSGSKAARFNEALRDSIVNFSCELWKKYPNWLTQNALPATAFARGFLNEVCFTDEDPPNPPIQKFTDGQCEGVQYLVQIGFEYENGQQNGVSQTVYGPILRMQGYDNGKTFGQLMTTEIDAYDFQGNYKKFFGGVGGRNSPLVNVTYEVFPPPGQPSCGNAGPDYNTNYPTSEDLTTIIVIPNPDGLDTNFNLTFNKYANNYNFPLSFDLNGISVVFDLGGISLYGSPRITSPRTAPDDDSNNPPAPKNTAPNDGRGGGDDLEYFNDYPTLPDLTSPETITEIIQYIACIDGVIEIVSESIKLIAGNIPWVNLLIDILGDILEDVCGIKDQEEGGAIVGLPEYWGLRPGAERPAIVYLWKELIGDKWQMSTYQSTVQHPSQDAIDGIGTLISFPKTMGKIVKALTLRDGSKIKTSGDTTTNANANFNFLIDQVNPSELPTDWQNKITTTTNERLQLKTVYLRQVEYYSKGGAAGVAPDIRKTLDPPMP